MISHADHQALLALLAGAADQAQREHRAAHARGDATAALGFARAFDTAARLHRAVARVQPDDPAFDVVAWSDVINIPEE